MTRRWIAPAFLVLSACSPDAMPPPAPPPRPVAKAPAQDHAPAPDPVLMPRRSVEAPPPPAEPPPAPPPLPTPAPVPAAAPRPSSLPRRDDAAATIFLPSFTIRTMEPGSPKVLINGEVLGASPCLWTITDAIRFDPNIPETDWPPRDAKLLGSTESAETRSKAEIWILNGQALRAKAPHLVDGEWVVYVRSQLNGDLRQGALRLFVEGHHWIDYTPLVNPEGDDASRFLRTIWFERN